LLINKNLTVPKDDKSVDNISPGSTQASEDKSLFAGESFPTTLHQQTRNTTNIDVVTNTALPNRSIIALLYFIVCICIYCKYQKAKGNNLSGNNE
jgi:hypothetical protein